MNSIDIVIKGKRFEIPTYLKERCEKYGVDIYGEYADKITNLKSPHLRKCEPSFTMNVFNAFYEKIYKSKFGPFVQIENSNIVAQSFELYDLLIKDLDKKYTYNFLNFYKKEMNPYNEKYDFYGCEINRVFYTNIENEPRPFMLNELIKTYLKHVQELAKGKSEILERDLKWRCFETCRRLHDWYSGFSPKFYQSYISEERFETLLAKLIKRYSLKSGTLFERVEQLNKYKDYVGIYVLCIKSKRMIYVGQTTSSLKKRILNHLTQRKTSFDNSIFPSEINEIYVLRTPHDIEMINKIESDCIATVDMKYTGNANSAASAYTIETLTSKSYDPSNYLLPKKTLSKYINDISFYLLENPINR